MAKARGTFAIVAQSKFFELMDNLIEINFSTCMTKVNKLMNCFALKIKLNNRNIIHFSQLQSWIQVKVFEHFGRSCSVFSLFILDN